MPWANHVGEILLAGPTVMREYFKHPDESAETLRKHDDGLTWVYTGDPGWQGCLENSRR